MPLPKLLQPNPDPRPATHLTKDSNPHMEIISLMKWPLIASLILPWLLVYLGLHIVQRVVIFVDLALAQTAAFGTCDSIVLGYDVHDWQSYAFSLGFTFVGAVVLTFTRSRDQ